MASGAVQAGFAKVGLKDAKIFMQGSAVTGVKYETKEAFDVGRKSDFDIAVVQGELFEKAKDLGLIKGDRSIPIDFKDTETLAKLGLTEMQEKLSKLAGRPVNFMIFETEAAVRAKEALSTFMPAKH